MLYHPSALSKYKYGFFFQSSVAAESISFFIGLPVVIISCVLSSFNPKTLQVVFAFTLYVWVPPSNPVSSVVNFASALALFNVVL